LVCTVNRSVVGGTEAYLQAILEVLATRYDLGLLYECEAPGATAIDRGLDLNPVWHLQSSSRDAVWGAITNWNPDVVYSHGMLDDVFEARLARYPVAYYAHNYVATCVSGHKMHAWPAPRPCTRALGWGCLWHYYPHRCGGLNPYMMWKYFRYQREKLRVLRSFHCILVASRAMRAEFLRHGFASERIFLLPLFATGYGPDPTTPIPRAWSGVILFAGRLTQLKGGDHLLRAVHQVAARKRLNRPLRVIFAGDGPEAGRWAELARTLEVPASFPGWLPRDEVKALMRQADLLAMPSLWPEPFGLAGIEAGCVGLPSVGYAHGGIPDWLVEGVSGTLAPSPPTVEGLADALMRGLEDPAHHQCLRIGAWREAQRFSLARHLMGLEEVFCSTNRRGVNLSQYTWAP
jgi:glycosyltransferase involved in cell wall biosynthesis